MSLSNRGVNLCATCRHHRIVVSRRGSEFWHCRLSETDSTFARYPRLPVLSCDGYQATSPPQENEDDS